MGEKANRSIVGTVGRVTFSLIDGNGGALRPRGRDGVGALSTVEQVNKPGQCLGGRPPELRWDVVWPRRFVPFH